jgi:IS30 family transposase
VTARLIPDLKPARFTAAAIQALGDKQTVTLTLDNGQENRHHRQLTKATGASVYFTDPYSSWQKGSVEHANKLLRNYFPKGCDLGEFDQDSVEAACARLNEKPRKILGYKSALQLAVEKGILTSRAGGALEG